MKLRILLPSIQQFDERVPIEKRFGGVGITQANLVEPVLDALVGLLGKRAKSQQLVGHTTHRRYDDADTRTRLRHGNARDALETACVGQAAAAEFMYFPEIARHDVIARVLRKAANDNGRSGGRLLFYLKSISPDCRVARIT